MRPALNTACWLHTALPAEPCTAAVRAVTHATALSPTTTLQLGPCTASPCTRMMADERWVRGAGSGGIGVSGSQNGACPVASSPGRARASARSPTHMSERMHMRDAHPRPCARVPRGRAHCQLGGEQRKGELCRHGQAPAGVWRAHARHHDAAGLIHSRGRAASGALGTRACIPASVPDTPPLLAHAFAAMRPPS